MPVNQARPRFYDYGSPYFKVYNAETGESHYFTVVRHGTKKAAGIAAKQYLKQIGADRLKALEKAGQTPEGLPRGFEIQAYIYTRTRGNCVTEVHAVRMSISAKISSLGPYTRSTATRPFSEVFTESTKEYARRLKLTHEEVLSLTENMETIRKKMIKKYRAACRNYGTKPRYDILKNLKQ